MSPFAKINSTKSPLLYSVVGALLLTLIVGGALAVVRHKTITLDVDGDMISLSTMSSSVGTALEDADTRSIPRTRSHPVPIPPCPMAIPSYCAVPVSWL